MGKIISRLNCMRQSKGILNDKELSAVRSVITALQANVEEIGHGWLFRPGPALHHQIVNEMVHYLQRGNGRPVSQMLQDGFRVEAAQALVIFLNRKTQCLLPDYIQALALDAPASVLPEMVATDVLGLIKQDLPTKRLELILLLLRLLDTVIKYSPADELRGSTLPLSMLPLFFNITNSHISDWRRIVTIFVELIRQGQNEANPNNTYSSGESSYTNMSRETVHMSI
ncbi:unnamed protein product [Brassicogethes aeneus]|uniref:Uncharacterized protein n=1 Tax=Brassicogethes aeneus TaxID=1431903 RepID=A0A9P0FFY6_BRAAE|nr:unnamed protein product [Brassicogethes aeneus]